MKCASPLSYQEEKERKKMYPVQDSVRMSPRTNISYLNLFFFLTVLGFELRAFTLSHSTSHFFVMGLFEIRSPELFA
jgi:hypothetical protein